MGNYFKLHFFKLSVSVHQVSWPVVSVHDAVPAFILYYCYLLFTNRINSKAVTPVKSEQFQKSFDTSFKTATSDTKKVTDELRCQDLNQWHTHMNTRTHTLTHTHARTCLMTQKANSQKITAAVTFIVAKIWSELWNGKAGSESWCTVHGARWCTTPSPWACVFRKRHSLHSLFHFTHANVHQ